MSIETLRQDVERLWAAGADASREEGRELFGRLRAALSEGTVRAASPDATSPTGWVVNSWVKQGILLGFRFGDLVDASMDHGRWPFFDKDTLPLQRFGAGSGVRIVPGGSSVRDGAHLAKGVIAMPPMYVNIGAYVGEGSMIDSHALVGSCAQIGARVHLSAAAQIGGVIEPVGAMPVIIEDDVLVGGNTRDLRRRRGQGASGDRRRHDPHRVHAGLRPPEWPHHPAGERTAARDSGRRGRRARRPRRDRGTRRRVEAVAGHARDRQVSRQPHRHAHRARTMDPLDVVALTRRLVDVESTTGDEAAVCVMVGEELEQRGYAVTRQTVTGERVNLLATVGTPEVIFSTHMDCVPPFTPSRVEGDRIHGRGSCDAKGILVSQFAASRRCAPPARRAWACCSWSARSGAATGR